MLGNRARGVPDLPLFISSLGASRCPRLIYKPSLNWHSGHGAADHVLSPNNAQLFEDVTKDFLSLWIRAPKIQANL